MDDFEIFRKLANCQDKEQMARVIEEYNVQNKPMTNADRIRAMTDEELAEFLVGANPTNCLDCAFSCGWRCQPDRQDYSDTEKCVEGKKRWLQQPAEGDA